MPFKSEKQRKYLYANKPKVAEKFQKDAKKSSSSTKRAKKKTKTAKKK